jgi:NAD(P)-dependent dehydrogenase (short-subunit alcohol dehydrogenase family)
MNYQMDGKTALVTGAGSGIGRATALAFAASGAAVMVSDVNADGGVETVDLIEKAGGQAQFFKSDVGNDDQVKALVAATVQAFGGLDFAFNNAGINVLGQDEYQPDVWDRCVNINLTGVMRCMREQSEVMLKNGGGVIVNNASINGLVGNGGQAAYTATKHGGVGLTRHGALRWAKAGVRVNAVCPGAIETPMTDVVAKNPDLRKVVDGMTPMGRMGQAHEIAAAVLWLCSDGASFVTGHALVVDGGATAF